MKGSNYRNLFKRGLLVLAFGVPLSTLGLSGFYHVSDPHESPHLFGMFPPIFMVMVSITSAYAVSLLLYVLMMRKRLSYLEDEVARRREVEAQMVLRTKALQREVEILSAVRELSRIVSERVVDNQKDAENVFSEVLKITEGLVGAEEIILFRENSSAGLWEPWVRRREGVTEIGDEINRVQIDFANIAEASEHSTIIQSGDEEGRVSFVVPLVADEKVLGVMKVIIPTEGTPDEKSEEIRRCEFVLENFSKHISLAMRKTSLYEHAFLDGLTSLYTKRHFMHQLESNFNYAKRYDKKLALMMIDVDHFKAINDTYGHLTGDNVLRDVAAVIRKEIRSYDSAYRYGGEEIAVILPNTNSREAQNIGERLRKKVEERRTIGSRREKVKVTISLGIAEFSPGMRTIDQLISRADQALYQAKEAGRNRVVVWRE